MHLWALYENRKTPPSGYYVLNIISYFALFRAKTKFCTIYCVLVTKKSHLDEKKDLSQEAVLAAGRSPPTLTRSIIILLLGIYICAPLWGLVNSMICEAIAVPRRRPRVDIFPSAFPSEVTTYYTFLIVQFSKIISFR